MSTATLEEMTLYSCNLQKQVAKMRRPREITFLAFKLIAAKHGSLQNCGFARTDLTDVANFLNWLYCNCYLHSDHLSTLYWKEEYDYLSADDENQPENMDIESDEDFSTAVVTTFHPGLVQSVQLLDLPKCMLLHHLGAELLNIIDRHRLKIQNAWKGQPIATLLGTLRKPDVAYEK